MKVKNICIVAGMLIATLIIFAGCVDGIAACPSIGGVEANYYDAAGIDGTPYATCGGYAFRRASCPTTDGWRVTRESKTTFPNDNTGVPDPGVYCTYSR